MAEMTQREQTINALVSAISQLTELTERNILQQLKTVVKNPVNIRRSYLQVYLPIANDQRTYVFDVAQGANETVNAPVSKLRDKEAFVVTTMSTNLVRVTNASGKPDGTERRQTFVNTNVFVTAAGFTPEHLNNFYRGEISWKIDNQTIAWSGFPMDLMEFVPQTQKTGATLENQYTPDFGKITPPAVSVLDGNKTNQFEVIVPAPNGTTQWASATAGVVHHLCLRLDGFRIAASGLQ